jgi:hypothetical protein
MSGRKRFDFLLGIYTGGKELVLLLKKLKTCVFCVEESRSFLLFGMILHLDIHLLFFEMTFISGSQISLH